jgi:hypothetical protein
VTVDSSLKMADVAESVNRSGGLADDRREQGAAGVGDRRRAGGFERYAVRQEEQVRDYTRYRYFKYPRSR